MAWADAMDAADANIAKISESLPSYAGANATTSAAKPGLKTWEEFISKAAPRNADGSLKVAGVGTAGGQSWFDDFVAWFNPVRLVTVALGLVILTAGIFALTKIPGAALIAAGAPAGAVKGAVKAIT